MDFISYNQNGKIYIREKKANLSKRIDVTHVTVPRIFQFKNISTSTSRNGHGIMDYTELRSNTLVQYCQTEAGSFQVTMTAALVHSPTHCSGFQTYLFRILSRQQLHLVSSTRIKGSALKDVTIASFPKFLHFNVHNCHTVGDMPFKC
jgi:hypothetical protein